MSTKHPRTFPAAEAAAWRRIRKYAVPRWMIEQATERREAGDWRGACTAANVDVSFSLAEVADEDGAETATALEEDLRHLAPGLLRWHMPRYLGGRTTLRINQRILLADYPTASMTRSCLYAATPKRADGPQRLMLGFGDSNALRPAQTHDWRDSRYLWDTRHAHELRFAVEDGFSTRVPDLELVRAGDVVPEQLHPLVSASLFPDRLGGTGPPGPQLPTAVKVRCHGEWHEVQSQDGKLQTPHTAEEEQRERAMRALGGPAAGCFAAQQAWRTGTGRLPKALREQRREFFSYVQHGDTPAVLQLLDAGIDPYIRNGRQQTLLHLLHLVDHETLLPRLLRAGLDLEAQDHEQHTPLCVAVFSGGSASLVRALVDAGARIDVTDQGLPLQEVIASEDREDDLRFLLDLLEGDSPSFGCFG